MTALRELAERWNEFGGSDYSGDQAEGRRIQAMRCAFELKQILDADGDGGAVGGMSLFTGTIGGVHVGLHGTKESVEALEAFLDSATHPARSGVVSDEDVRDAARYRWLRSREGISYLQISESAIDAAIAKRRTP